MTRGLFDMVNAMFPSTYDWSESYTPAERVRLNSIPRLNVLEDDDNYTLQLAAPGVRKEEVQVKLDEHDHLVISMEKKTQSETTEPGANADEAATAEDKPVRYLRREFSFSSFTKRIALPDDVDREQIKANMENGVLEVLLPKIKPEEKQPGERMITIG